ncbi:transposase [Sorangium sp. So ce362]|uniref:transposase n=1 Tax=Sorangium sp. So ce362 TaxID=3133303 RepID=UPI003F62A567
MPKPGKRRKFSAAEELRIVREAAACAQRGDIEALLRREGIYSSLLAAWRKQLALHGSEALAERKPGRKPKQDAKGRRIAELEKRSARLEEKLAFADKLIDLQKKVSAILGVNLTTDGERRWTSSRSSMTRTSPSRRRVRRSASAAPRSTGRPGPRRLPRRPGPLDVGGVELMAFWACAN